MSPYYEIAQAVQDTQFFTAVRESAVVYPVVLSTHLSMIAIFGGLILLTDLRLLGVTLTSVPASEIVRRTRPLKWIGFLIMITCGILLGGAKLLTYYDNPYFILKMSLLVCVGIHALVFRRSVYRNPEALDNPKGLPRAAKVAACLSMVLWVAILSNGRWIAYWEGADPNASIRPAGVVQSPLARLTGART
jgi:hypothetical protein